MFNFAKINIILTNYYDGGKQDRSLFSSHEKRTSSFMEKGPPSFTDYMDYILFLPAATGCGPVVEYYQVHEFLN